MTMCLELKVPNLVTRTRLWRQMGEAEGVLLHDADAVRLARLVLAAPAVASTALRATTAAAAGVTRDQPDRQYFPGISGNGGADRHRSSRCSLSGGFGYGPALKLAAVALFPHRLHAAP
jgi:hypothetical protein